MVTLLYILLFLAIWHFFYESILAPSLRHGLRYKFFKLRDDLRSIKIENSLSKKDEKIFNILDDSTSSMINSMSFISFANYYLLQKELKKNNNIKLEIEEIKNSISKADNKQFLSIDKDIKELGAKALAINNGGWIVYFIVPLFAILLIALVFIEFDKLTKLIKKISSYLIYSSDSKRNLPQLA